MHRLIGIRGLKRENVSCGQCTYLAFSYPFYIFITKKSQKVID